MYNLEATPAEGTTYRFAREDRKRFPDIIQAGTPEAPYYTNSLPATGGLYGRPLPGPGASGGAAAQVYRGHGFSPLPGRAPVQHVSCHRLVRRILENYRIPYLTVTPTFSICPKHGYLAGNIRCARCATPIPSPARSGRASWATTGRWNPSTRARRPSTVSAASSAKHRGRNAMMKIGGFTPFTTIDYPDHMSAVVFCQGAPGGAATATTGNCWTPGARDILMERYRGLSPWAQRAAGCGGVQRRRADHAARLLQAAQEAKNMGFLVGLHTGGAFPDALPPLFPYLDWIGMDIKAHFSDYERITGVAESGEAAQQSAALVRASGVRRRFRTTWIQAC